MLATVPISLKYLIMIKNNLNGNCNFNASTKLILLISQTDEYKLRSDVIAFPF